MCEYLFVFFFFLRIRRHARSQLFPYTTLSRDDAEEVEMDLEDEMMDSVEYDLDEEVAEDEVVEEATKLSDNVAEPKGGEADSKESPLSSAPKKNFKVDGVKGGIDNKDGGDGDSGDNKPKDHTPTDNIKVEPKKA